MQKAVNFLVDSFSRLTGVKVLSNQEQHNLAIIQRNLSALSLEAQSRLDQITGGRLCPVKVVALRKALALIHHLAQRHLSVLNRRYLRTRVPWSAGYLLYKDQELDRFIAEPAPLPADGSYFGQGLDERIVELPWVVKQIPKSSLVLDAGSALNHEVVLRHLGHSQIYITTLYPELYRNNSGVSYVYQDLRSLPFRDDYFDCVASVSTIEHIGLDTRCYKNQAGLRDFDTVQGDHLSAIAEMKRVVKPGGEVLITAPFGRQMLHKNQWQIFDLAMVQQIIAAFDPAASELRFYRYTDQGWCRASADDCARAEYHGNGSPGSGAVFLLKLSK